MIKARIRWCTCRVENILTLGKLLNLWFCFLLHSILFLISQTSYRTYKIISSYELARPVMGTIFLVHIHMHVYTHMHMHTCTNTHIFIQYYSKNFSIILSENILMIISALDYYGQ